MSVYLLLLWLHVVHCACPMSPQFVFIRLVMSQSSAPTTSSQQSTPSTPLSQLDGKILLGNGNVNLAHMHARLRYSPHPFVWRHHHSQTPRSLSMSHGQNQLNLSEAKKDDFPTLSSITILFVRRPRSACPVERTFNLMGHIQTKDRLHMGNNTLRHLAMMYVNKPTKDHPDGESDSFGPIVLCMLSHVCEFNFPHKRRYLHVQVEACRGTRNFSEAPHMLEHG